MSDVYTDTPEGRAARAMGFLPPRTTQESLRQREAIADYLHDERQANDYGHFADCWFAFTNDARSLAVRCEAKVSEHLFPGARLPSEIASRKAHALDKSCNGADERERSRLISRSWDLRTLGTGGRSGARDDLNDAGFFRVE